jgi:hypothetical protein
MSGPIRPPKVRFRAATFDLLTLTSALRSCRDHVRDLGTPIEAVEDGSLTLQKFSKAITLEAIAVCWAFLKRRLYKNALFPTRFSVAGPPECSKERLRLPFRYREIRGIEVPLALKAAARGSLTRLESSSIVGASKVARSSRPTAKVWRMRDITCMASRE